MPRHPNPLDRLRAANPVDAAYLPAHDSERAQQVLAEILTTPRPAPAVQVAPAPRWSGRRLTAAVAIGFAALAAMAAGSIWLRPVDEPVGVRCYQSLNVDGSLAAAQSGSSIDPFELCGPYWLDGTLTNPEVAAAGLVPPLLGCVNDIGALSVFPSADPDTCQRLGLSLPDPLSVPTAESVRALRDRLVAYFLAADSASLPDAATDVRQILDANGFADWSIEERAPTRDRPCASLSFDATDQTIRLVPIPLAD